MLDADSLRVLISLADQLGIKEDVEHWTTELNKLEEELRNHND